MPWSKHIISLQRVVLAEVLYRQERQNYTISERINFWPFLMSNLMSLIQSFPFDLLFSM